MAKFITNAGYDDSKTVEADFFKEEGSLITFFDRAGNGARGEQVYAVPTKSVVSIERTE